MHATFVTCVRFIGSAMEVLNEIGHGFHEKIYLKVTNLQVGLLINFKHPKLEFKRVVR